MRILTRLKCVAIGKSRPPHPTYNGLSAFATKAIMYTRSMLAALPEPTASPATTATRNEHSEASFRTVASMATSLAERNHSQNLQRRPIIIWDTETTGLSPDKHHIVEIALEELGPPNGQSSMLSFSSLVHPVGVKMPRAAERVHGITNAMMRDSPTFAQVWPDLAEYVSDVTERNGGLRPIFVAHNMSFDLRFLKEELRKIEAPLPRWDFACSLRDVAHVLWPKKPAKLADLAKRFGVVNEEAHRALCDVRATATVLHRADEWLSDKHKANQHAGAPPDPLKQGDRIRAILEDAALKRREAVHGKDVADAMRVEDERGDVEVATWPSVIDLGSEDSSEEDEEDLEEMSNVSDDEVDDDEVQAPRYHWVPGSDRYHNRRDCFQLELSDCIESSERAPAGRKLCRSCKFIAEEAAAREAAAAAAAEAASRSASTAQSVNTPPRRSPRSVTAAGVPSPTSIMSTLTSSSDEAPDNDVTMEGGFEASKRRRQPWYIAPTGRLYHASRACSNLELAKTIRRIDSLMELQSLPGKRYRCSLCFGKKA